MARTSSYLIVLVSFFFCVSASHGQDAGLRDSIRIGCPFVFVNVAHVDTFQVPVYIYNDEPLQSLVIGFKFNHPMVHGTGFIPSGYLAECAPPSCYFATGVSNDVLIVQWSAADPGNALPAAAGGSYVLGNITGRIDSGIQPGCANVDTAAAPSSQALVFAPVSGASFIPVFSQCFFWVDSGFGMARISQANTICFDYWDATSDLQDELQSSENLNFTIHPNPFNSGTSVEIVLMSAQNVEIAIHDVLGRRIKSLAKGVFSSGQHRFEWNACDESGRAVASGVYFAKIRNGTTIGSRKMIVLR